MRTPRHFTQYRPGCGDPEDANDRGREDGGQGYRGETVETQRIRYRQTWKKDQCSGREQGRYRRGLLHG
jgi:hypothetical protein